MRDNKWLAAGLQKLHDTYFTDVPIENLVLVQFGRAAKTRFGSIIAKKRSGYTQPVTVITINGLFRDEAVPEYVILATLFHEFVHYTHGFHSPRRQLFSHPHKGGIVDKEIRARGGGFLLTHQKKWIKQEYRAFLRQHKLL